MTNDLTQLQDWEGDTEELVGHEDALVYDAELCDQIFCSKQEAFAAGLSLGQKKPAE